MLPIPAIPPILMQRRDWTVPSPEWEEWARATFVDSESDLCDPRLAHLQAATVCFLLTNASIKVKGERKAGLGGVWKPSGEPHSKAQRVQQMVEWIGMEPDFVVTLDVDSFQGVRDICRLVNHELAHCGQAEDEHGSPRFDLKGEPLWSTVPHYAELNEGDLARWGAEITPGGRTIVRELAAPPLITDAMLRFDAV